MIVTDLAQMINMLLSMERVIFLSVFLLAKQIGNGYAKNARQKGEQGDVGIVDAAFPLVNRLGRNVQKLAQLAERQSACKA